METPDQPASSGAAPPNNSVSPATPIASPSLFDQRASQPRSILQRFVGILGNFLRSPLLWIAIVLAGLRTLALHAEQQLLNSKLLYPIIDRLFDIDVFLEAWECADCDYERFWTRPIFFVSAWLPILWLAWGNRNLIVRLFQSLVCVFGLLAIDHSFTLWAYRLGPMWSCEREWLSFRIYDVLLNLAVVIWPWYFARLGGLVALTNVRSESAPLVGNKAARHQISLWQLMLSVTLIACALSTLIPRQAPVLTTLTSAHNFSLESQLLQGCVGIAPEYKTYWHRSLENELSNELIMRDATIWIIITILTAICVSLTTWTWYVRGTICLVYLFAHLRFVIEQNIFYGLFESQDYDEFRWICYLYLCWLQKFFGVFLAFLVPFFFLRFCGYRIHFFPSRELLDSALPPGTGKWGRVYARL